MLLSDAGLTFMAVKDYEPRYFSQSGRATTTATAATTTTTTTTAQSGCADQELALCEGDIVRQIGM